VGGLLGWQQSVLIDVDREAFDNDTFDKFGNERQVGDGPVGAGDVWIQCGLYRLCRLLCCFDYIDRGLVLASAVRHIVF